MSSTMLARSAYAAAAPTRTSRGTEYAAFQKVTAQLVRAGRPGATMPQRASALHDNRRLWAILATDLAAEGNALPDALRARLLYLAEFSLLQSGRALRDETALKPLIDINTSVMRGLSGEGGAS